MPGKEQREQEKWHARIQLICVAAGAAFLLSQSQAMASDSVSNDVVTGAKAYGGWEQNDPGRKLLIRPGDMPEPLATPSASNSAGLVAKPDDARPRVMDGFEVAQFAAGLAQPRAMTVAPNGDIFVADSAANEVHVFRMGQDGKVTRHNVFASGFDQPYGLAFYPNGPDARFIYVANTGSVVRYAYKSGDMAATGKPETVIEELPTGHHWTRDIAFSNDGKTLFVSVGSGSNVATRTMQRKAPKGFIEQNPKGATWGEERNRADVLAFDPDGGKQRIYATGLRNCSGLAVQPVTGNLWCVVNERDQIGSDLPPDYATHVRQGGFYGWPWYYIGDHKDPRWSKAPREDLTGKVDVPDVLLQPHSAPLDIAFYEGRMFPPDFAGDAFVTMHGSWNRDRRTGYKVVRLIFDNGKPTGVYQDFLTGFVVDGRSVWGRPVGVAVARDGSLLVSEDGSGTIWCVSAEKGAGE